MRRLLNLPLHQQIALALAAAILAGLVTGGLTGKPLPWALHIYRVVGTLFLNALKMITIPLVVTAVIHAIAQIGGAREFGRLGAKTFAFYLTTTTIAVLTGLLFVQAIRPGIVNARPARELIGLTADSEAIKQRVAGRSLQDFTDVVLRMVPENVVQAAAQGDLLGLIVFSLLTGFFLARMPGSAGASLRIGVQAVFELMMRMTEWILRFAPLGVFALVARVVATTGLEAWRPLAAFFASVVLALGTHLFVTMPLLIFAFARVNPIRHFRAVAPAMLTAFSTSSSNATLPVTLECLEKRAGVSNRIAGFVAPLGATVNMDGTALYECVAALFIAQAYGLELSWAAQATVVALAILTSIGVAGIPAASLVAIVVILETIGLPPEGIGLLLATDRILDMCRTAVNVFGDTAAAVVIARSEGEATGLEGGSASPIRR
ncbi:MAG: dicarboxylate/amino acid:cation symporter [Kiritimatiellae bacterium]|nr:dicarboxylate/amino acid:cation symporter [Kiritimatiellia bacterium]MDW8459451.1 dicarboxylate/amino acid:cation symporter [Verrucomicrobiota bacterium]